MEDNYTGGFRRKPRPSSMGRNGDRSEKASPTSRMRIRAVPVLRLPHNHHNNSKKTKDEESIILPFGVGHGESFKEMDYVSFISTSKSASTASSARSDYNGAESESTPHSAHSEPMSPVSVGSSSKKSRKEMKHHKSEEKFIQCPMCHSHRKKVKLGLWAEYASTVYYCGHEDRTTGLLCGHVFMPSCPLVMTTRVVLFCQSQGNRVEFQ
jgi:hypothetical protein